MANSWPLFNSLWSFWQACHSWGNQSFSRSLQVSIWFIINNLTVLIQQVFIKSTASIWCAFSQQNHPSILNLSPSSTHPILQWLLLKSSLRKRNRKKRRLFSSASAPWTYCPWSEERPNIRVPWSFILCPAHRWRASLLTVLRYWYALLSIFSSLSFILCESRIFLKASPFYNRHDSLPILPWFPIFYLPLKIVIKKPQKDIKVNT